MDIVGKYWKLHLMMQPKGKKSKEDLKKKEKLVLNVIEVEKLPKFYSEKT